MILNQGIASCKMRLSIYSDISIVGVRYYGPYPHPTQRIGIRGTLLIKNQSLRQKIIAEEKFEDLILNHEQKTLWFEKPCKMKRGDIISLEFQNLEGSFIAAEVQKKGIYSNGRLMLKIQEFGESIRSMIPFTDILILQD